MILQLTPNTHPILHEKVRKCSYDLDRVEMSKILRENMIHHEGVGLSANQIGINERVFIMMIDMETEETITCFNPRIVKTYDKRFGVKKDVYLFLTNLLIFQDQKKLL